ncbi:glutamic acid-rich protein-like [Capsicum annuum]|uniref:glutamic acid-rich protein-like n=1 Tax=Capsicum annuum TaxID=4072 RepID=UPI001FB10A0C|nr:glutamic acid-rich protein-like [Capsicum annuum]
MSVKTALISSNRWKEKADENEVERSEESGDLNKDKQRDEESEGDEKDEEESDHNEKKVDVDKKGDGEDDEVEEDDKNDEEEENESKHEFVVGDGGGDEVIVVGGSGDGVLLRLRNDVFVTTYTEYLSDRLLVPNDEFDVELLHTRYDTFLKNHEIVKDLKGSVSNSEDPP